VELRGSGLGRRLVWSICHILLRALVTLRLSLTRSTGLELVASSTTYIHLTASQPVPQWIAKQHAAGSPADEVLASGEPAVGQQKSAQRVDSDQVATIVFVQTTLFTVYINKGPRHQNRM
jgi:hypothetical protein